MTHCDLLKDISNRRNYKMASKGKSIAAVAARALGIETKYLPERLRNRLNSYVRDERLKALLFDEEEAKLDAQNSPSASDRTSRPVRAGNTNLVRNLVILDTLFEDKSIITGWLKGAEISEEILDQYFTEWRTKKILYQTLEARLPKLKCFFSKRDINWAKDEIPYPFSEGKFSADKLIADVVTADENPSSYDRALKAVLINQFGELGRILDQSPDEFLNGERQWLILLYQAKRKEYEEYYALLNKY